MKLRIHAFSAVVAGAVAFALAVPTAQALNKDQEKCQATVAKEAGKFMKAVLKEKAKCADKNLKDTGSCDFAKRDEKIDKAVTKLRSGLQKKCVDKFPAGFDPQNLATIGFPGKCPDSDPSDGFTGEDLKECMVNTHTNIANAVFDLEYGSNGDDGVTDFETRDPVNGKDLGKCQKELGKNGQKLLLTIQKEISKCRDNLIKGKFSGFIPQDCGDNLIEPKPGEKIAKASTKTIDKIVGKCPPPLFATGELDACDTGSGPQTTPTDAANCIVDSHKNATDDPDNGGTATPFATDLIDIEYNLGAICGDGVKNDRNQPVIGSLVITADPIEECDRDDDDACPGACGLPTGKLPVRLYGHAPPARDRARQLRPRQRVDGHQPTTPRSSRAAATWSSSTTATAPAARTRSAPWVRAARCRQTARARRTPRASAAATSAAPQTSTCGRPARATRRPRASTTATVWVRTIARRRSTASRSRSPRAASRSAS